MNVIVLYGGVGGVNCHIEVFPDTKDGETKAENRRSYLESLNGNSWGLKVKRFRVQTCALWE